MSTVLLTEKEQERYLEMYGVRQPDLPPGVTLRRARLEDREAIMEMSRMADISGGHDYLGIRYQEYAADPDRYMYLAEKEGKVVRYLDEIPMGLELLYEKIM